MKILTHFKILSQHGTFLQLRDKDSGGVNTLTD